MEKVIGIGSIGIPWKPRHSQHILPRSRHRIVPASHHMTRVTVRQPIQRSDFNTSSEHARVIRRQFPREIYWCLELISILLSICLHPQLVQPVKQVCLSFGPALIACQAKTCRVGIHRPSGPISSWPSPSASQMPRLPTHCLHTSIKSSIFLRSTPDLAINTPPRTPQPSASVRCLRVDA